MDFDFIERVVRLVEKAEIGELELESEEGLRLVVKKTPPPAPQAAAPVYYTGGHPSQMSFPSAGPSTSPQQPVSEPVDDSVEIIKAPMVGTFYRSPAPDAPTFVEVRDVVQKNTVVCILEAMKVMNEIKAGVAGIIAEILVENGQPVEFGQPLFKVKKQ